MVARKARKARKACGASGVCVAREAAEVPDALLGFQDLGGGLAGVASFSRAPAPGVAAEVAAGSA